MKNMVLLISMKKYLPIILFLLFILFSGVSFFVIFESKTLFSRASEKTSQISEENSYIFISPVESDCQAREIKQMTRINVFVLDQVGKPVIGARVQVNSTSTVLVKGLGLTDNFGRAIFDVTCVSPADSYLPVVVDGKTISSKAHIVFK